MRYALDTNERFAAPQTISVYSPATQNAHNDDRMALGVKSLQDELLGIRFPNGTRSIAIPYLKELIHYAAPIIPHLKTAHEFAQSPQGLIAARATIQNFNLMQAKFVGVDAERLLSINEAADLLNISRAKITEQMQVIGAKFSLVRPSPDRSRTVRHISGAVLNRLYEWHYPSNFPIELINIDSPESSP